MNKLVLSVKSILVFASTVCLSHTVSQSAGVINNHHGILTDEDIKMASENSFPATPFNGQNPFFPYWQCFDKKHLYFKCSYNKPLSKVGSALSIQIETTFENHIYSHSHAISGEVCNEMRARLIKLLKNQRYFCVNGTNDSVESAAKKKIYFWSLYRLKTKLGYVHYFQH